MLPCTPALAALLDAWRNSTSAAPFVAELYTFTLPSGVVIRWTSADIDITYNGLTWSHNGPGLERSQITKQTGTQASELDVTLYMDDDVLYNGNTLASFVAGNGFVNTILQFSRGYAEAPGKPIVGTLPKFTGRITQMKDTGETQATLVAMNWMSLLNVQVPVNVWQPPCLHTVFDSGCTLNRASFKKTGTVQGGSDASNLVTSLTVANGYLDLGTIVFTSGPNNGQTRTIKAQSGGLVTLVRALPNAPKPSDKFNAYPGCDLTQATCATKFNNLAHFKGFPFVPLAETAAP